MYFLSGLKKSKVQKEATTTNNDQLDNTAVSNETTNNETLNNNVLIYCIVDDLFSKKPVFNEYHKTLRLFADRDIIMKPREFRVIHTNEKIYISEYVYNFGTISNKYSGTFLIIQFNFLNEGALNQQIKITLKNLSCFTYKIPKDDELGVITFVTDKKVNFQLVTTYQIIFDPLTKTILQNDDGKRRISKCV